MQSLCLRYSWIAIQALALWQHGTRLLADLELQLYREGHSKANLLRAQAHFEAAFPVLVSLRSHCTDDALPAELLSFMEQVLPSLFDWWSTWIVWIPGRLCDQKYCMVGYSMAPDKPACGSFTPSTEAAHLERMPSCQDHCRSRT